MARRMESTATFVWFELTVDDLQKREIRRNRKSDGELNPRLFQWHRRFSEKIARCPYCGDVPKLLAIFDDEDLEYSYKFSCERNLESVKCDLPNRGWCDMGCGDWYHTLSRAGLSWNYRVAEALGGPHRFVRHKPLTAADM